MAYDYRDVTGQPTFRESTLEDLEMFTQVVGTSMVNTYAGHWLNRDEFTFHNYFWEEVHDPVSQDHYRQQLSPSETRRSWVAEVSGILVGAMTTELLPDDTVEIHKLHALRLKSGPGVRQGIGHRLLQLGFDFWGDDRPFSLEVLHFCKGAINLYEKYGFEFDQPRIPIRYDGQIPAGHLREFYAYRMTRPAKSL